MYRKNHFDAKAGRCKPVIGNNAPEIGFLSIRTHIATRGKEPGTVGALFSQWRNEGKKL